MTCSDDNHSGASKANGQKTLSETPSERIPDATFFSLTASAWAKSFRDTDAEIMVTNDAAVQALTECFKGVLSTQSSFITSISREAAEGFPNFIPSRFGADRVLYLLGGGWNIRYQPIYHMGFVELRSDDFDYKLRLLSEQILDEIARKTQITRRTCQPKKRRRKGLGGRP